jgi:hypothetical protein
MRLKVSQIAEKCQVSRDAVYLWIRDEVIPESCVERIGSTIRIDEDAFERLLREGRLARPRKKGSAREVQNG